MLKYLLKTLQYGSQTFRFKVKTPYGWQHSVDAYEGSVGYAEEYSEDYPSYSEDYVSYPDPTQPSYEVNLLPKFDYHPLANNLGNNQPPQQNAPTNGPNPDFVATTLTPKPTESNNDHEKKVNDQDPVPIHPIQAQGLKRKGLVLD